ncbi:MAG: cysteine hydrolase family protein [Candidatus Promineifilaceae bacterium]
MDTLPENAVLLLIDVQDGMDAPYWGERNNPQAESNMVQLLTTWRETGRPVYHVKHNSVSPNSPLRPNQAGNVIKAIVQPQAGEPLFEKSVNSAFIGTNLEQQLRDNGYETLVIVGLTTQHCVSTTTRMAGNLGFETYLVSDGTAAFELTRNGKRFSAEHIHETALAMLDGEFATVVDTETILSTLA